MSKLKKKIKSKIRVQGWDLSLGHGGFVELLDGELDNFWYVTGIKSSVEKSKNGSFLKKPKFMDKQQWNINRLFWWWKYLSNLVMSASSHYYGVEDYALDANYGAHYKGELGGIAKLVIKKGFGSKLRLHDPLSVKMFAAHNGHADKSRVESSVKERWGVDFSKFNGSRSRLVKKSSHEITNCQTSQDLADAFAVAQLVWTEIRLRRGDLMLSDLHEKEIRVFNRVTEAYPISLLSRDWII